MKAACFSGSSLRDTVFGLRCSIPSRCNSATKPQRLSYSMLNSFSIQAPTSRVVRGSIFVIQAFSILLFVAQPAGSTLVAEAGQTLDPLFLIQPIPTADRVVVQQQNFRNRFAVTGFGE